MSSVFLLMLQYVENYHNFWDSVEGVYSTKELAEKRGQEVYGSWEKNTGDGYCGWCTEEWEIDDNTI